MTYNDEYVAKGSPNSQNPNITNVLPDLVVTDISFPLRTYSVGEDLQITFRVANQGQTPAKRFVVSVYVDKDIIKDIPWDKGLEDGGNLRETVSWKATTGNHIFKVVVDNYKEVSESNETNNEKSIDYSGAVLPDLVVTDISFPLHTYSVGEDLQITFRVGNQGQTTAQRFVVSVYVDKDIIKDIPWDKGLEGGGNLSETVSWEATTGNHIFKVVVDNYKEVSESNETNNEKSIDYSGTILPDLVVSNLRWELSGPYFGEVAIYAEIKNQGQGSFLVPQNAKNYITVTVKGDGQIIKLGFIYKLLPGETVTLYGVCRIMPGLNTVTADIDTQNLFTESDETNNTATITFTKDEVLGR
jgi:subtilase family serine protease